MKKFLVLLFAFCFAPVSAQAATRWYLPSTSSTAPVTPAYSGSWNENGAMDRLRMVRTRRSSSMTTKETAKTTGTNTYIGLRQYVSDPLIGSGTLSGTVSASVRGIESNNGFNAYEAVVIRLFSRDGTTERGVLLALTVEETENTTSLVSKDLLSTAALTSQSYVDGDRIVVDFGYSSSDNNTSRTSGMSFGDNGAADLDLNDADTGADNPWIEFSADLAVYSERTVIPAGGGDYSSLNAWEAAEQDDINTKRVIARATCSGSTADTTGTTVAGWTTGASYYIDILSGASDRAGLAWASGKYRLSVTNANALLINENYIRLTGLQFSLESQSTDNLATIKISSIDAGGSDMRISKCYVKFTSTTLNTQSLYVNDADATVSAWNSVLGGPQITASLSYAATAMVYNGVLDLNNCTLYGNKYGTAILFGSGTYRVKNCYSGNSGTSDYAEATLTTCGSEDSTGTSGLTSIAYATGSGAYFTNVGSGTEDFTIANASSSLIGAATDGPFTAPLDYTDDILGNSRSDWDLGAHEYQVAATGRRAPAIGGSIGVGIGGGMR